jgi:uncharacterized protein YbjT (DUF2867 family)
MIVITTPTGDIGHQVLGHVTGGTESIRVIARDPSKLPVQVSERVDVRVGSHGDPAVVDAALQGADALFWLVPPDFQATEAVRRYVEFSRPAADAVSRHGVGHVVVVSALGRGYNGDAGLVTASLQMTGLFESTGASTRALANPGFMENMLRNVDSIRSQGVVYGTLAGDRRLPYVSTRDIAAVAARLLTPTGAGSATATFHCSGRRTSAKTRSPRSPPKCWGRRSATSESLSTTCARSCASATPLRRCSRP